MVDILSGLTEQPNVLDGLTNLQETQPVADPETINRTARMAAIANTDILGNDVGAEVEALTEKYRQLIELSGEQQIRYEAAHNESQNTFNALVDLAANPDPGLDPDGSLAAGARSAASAVIQEDIKERAESALERETVKRIQGLASKDPTQAKVLLNSLEMGDVEDIITEMNTKKLILQREIERAGIEKDQQGWFRDVTDFVLSVVPFNVSAGQVGNVDVPGLVKEWGDNLLAGRRRRAEASNLWNLPANEFARYVREELIPNVRENSTLFGYTDKTEQLNILSGLMDTPSVLETNAWNALDNFGWIPLAKMSQGALSIPGLMVRNGARVEAGEVIARAVKVAADEGAESALAKTGMNLDEVVDATLPSAVNPNKSVTIPVSSEVITAMQRADELIAQLPEMLPTDRFVSQTEFRTAVEKFTEQLKTMYNREIKDVDVVEQPLSTGSVVRNLEITLGTTKGGAFPTKRGASQYLASIGNVGYVVQDESGGFFVKITKNMPETGFYSVQLNPGQGKFLGITAQNPVYNTILNARMISDKFLADLAQRGTNRLSKTLKATVEPLAQKLSKLSNKQKQDLGNILEKSRKDGRWFTRAELDLHYERTYNRPISQAELEGYQAYQRAKDIEWLLRNDDLYMQKHLRGFETVSFDTPLGSISFQNALVNRIMDRLPAGRVYNVERNLHHTKDGNPLSQDMLDLFKAEGYVLVTTENAVKLADGTRIKHFLVKSKNAKFQPLNREQLAYRAGGHTFYEGKYFSKQAVKRVQPDTREEFLDNPNTYIVGSKAEVDWWNSKMEAARLTLKQMMDEGVVDVDQLDEIFDGHPGLPDGEEFVRLVEEGKFQIDTPFVTKYDRELPDEYLDANPDEYDFGGTDGWLRTNGRMYYSGKGEDLPDWRGNMSRIIDPYESINKALMNIANLSSFADYKVSAVERWVKTYGKYLTGYKPGASDLTKFSDAQIVKGTDQRIVNVAEKQRQLIRRTIGWKTDADLAQDHMVRSMIDWVNGSDPEGVRNAVATKVTNWYNNSDPVAALRALAFDAKMGLLNITQLPLQMSTMGAIMALSPKHGFSAMMNLVPLRQYLTKSGTDHYLNELVKRGVHKSAGFSDAAEFKQFMKNAKNSGFLDIGGTHGMINSYGPSAAMTNTGSKVEQMRQKARFFFNEGELWNRITAMHVAWKEVREQLPDLAYKDPEFIRRWEGRAEDYSMGMSRETQAWWQRGVMSIPTQFWAYQARMLEALLGNTFTPAQRLRLAVAQSLLYGSAGLPVVDIVSEKLKADAGEAPDLNTFWGTVDRGLVDTFFYNVTGGDAMIGQRFGTGPWLTDVVKELFGFSQYGEKSFAEIAGGATGSTLFTFLGDSWNVLDKVIKYSVAEGGGELDEPITREDLTRLAKNISTYNVAHRAFLVDRLGTLESKRGDVILNDIPRPTAGLILLFGAQPGAQDDLSAKLAYLKDKKTQVQDAAKVIQMYRVKALNEPEKFDEYAREINVYTRLLPPEIRVQAIKQVHKNMDKSLYEGVTRQIEKNRLQEEAIKRLEE